MCWIYALSLYPSLFRLKLPENRRELLLNKILRHDRTAINNKSMDKYEDNCFKSLTLLLEHTIFWDIYFEQTWKYWSDIQFDKVTYGGGQKVVWIFHTGKHTRSFISQTR